MGRDRGSTAEAAGVRSVDGIRGSGDGGLLGKRGQEAVRDASALSQLDVRSLLHDDVGPVRTWGANDERIGTGDDRISFELRFGVNTR